MFKRIAHLMFAAALLTACATSAPPAAAPPPAAVAAPPPAHQAEENPKLPQAKNPHAKDGKNASDKTKLSFDLPPPWEQAPAADVRKPWVMGLLNRELRGQVLVEFTPRAETTAADAAAEVVDGVCKANGWTCSAPQPLSSGDGASFTFTTAKKTRGKIAFRDLAGPSRCQLQLFGLWPKDSEAEATKDFDKMLSSAEVQ